MTIKTRSSSDSQRGDLDPAGVPINDGPLALDEQPHPHYTRNRHERDQAAHERDQLRQMLDNAPIVTPVIATNRDTENGGEKVQANHENLAGSDDPKWGFKARCWLILLIVVAVAVPLALVLPAGPTPPEPTTQEPTPSQDLIELLSSASSDGGVALADPSTPQNMALKVDCWISKSCELY